MKRLAAILALLLFSLAPFAQETPKQQPQPPQAQQPSQKPGEKGHAVSPSAQLAEASEHAAAEEDKAAAFKESPSVRWVASLTGLGAKTAYWVLVLVNFAIIAGLIALLWKAKVPAMFRSRTASIQKGVEEARKASADASRRLGEIEQRLTKLDTEIAAMRAAAEADAAAEEERIRAAAEEDKRKVIETAEQEIAAAARTARRELKAYAADLAVKLAERRIQVDSRTDQALVQSFVEQLGEPGANGAGKEKR